MEDELLTQPSEEKVYHCRFLQGNKICKFSTTSLDSMRFHNETVHPRIFVCPICEKEFTNRKQIFQHGMEAHGEKLDTPRAGYRCRNETCLEKGIKFLTRKKLLEHKMEVHGWTPRR